MLRVRECDGGALHGTRRAGVRPCSAPRRRRWRGIVESPAPLPAAQPIRGRAFLWRLARRSTVSARRRMSLNPQLAPGRVGRWCAAALDVRTRPVHEDGRVKSRPLGPGVFPSFGPARAEGSPHVHSGSRCPTFQYWASEALYGTMSSKPTGRSQGHSLFWSPVLLGVGPRVSLADSDFGRRPP